ncbi:uncharacterized protein LOC122071499 [Macadamia integrifolia]|uniref:uncharacterized protein LOC122071499 n=1 Tax=Macadamia integrifolia TaxID=60698 RepID=UPI001C4EFB72|nr:uncharacterized protein LOC122071499 [Macadamia integrifolia]
MVDLILADVKEWNSDLIFHWWPDDIAQSILSMLIPLFECCTIHISWSPPVNFFFKINFDGSSSGSQGLVGIGGVCCNNSGKFIFRFACYVGATFAYVVEALATPLALKMAKDHNSTHVILEGDSQLVVDLIVGRLSSISWRIAKD